MTTRRFDLKTDAVALVVLMIIIAALSPNMAWAHGSGVVHPDSTISRGPRNWSELWSAWAWEPGVLIAMALSAFLYARGTYRLWREAGYGKGIRYREAAYFAAGWLALVVALVSPLHPWGSVLFSAHMSQHEILMLVAAPLLVLGRPMIAFLKALPRSWLVGVIDVTSSATIKYFWHSITNPFAAWLIHAAVLWIWHVPAFFEATLTNEWIHALQHFSFLASALLFWWALIQGPHYLNGYGVAVLYLFTTALHSGLLGVLITFASTVWYPAYAKTTASWGLTALEDQQLGGLIMWVPACAIYILAGLVFFAAWLRRSEDRSKGLDAIRRQSGPGYAPQKPAIPMEGL